MKAINQLRKRKGVSPVIATVILVAVAITVSVAVAYWMSGIAGQYTSFEKVELPVHYSQYTDDIDGNATTIDVGWKEHIELKNSGSKDATINNIFLNNIPLRDYAGIILTWTDPLDVTTTIDLTTEEIVIPVAKGFSVEVVITIPATIPGITAGTTVDFKITTAAGNQYPILEVLA